MKNLKDVPLENLIDILLQIYELGYEYADITIIPGKKDKGYVLSVVGVGEKTELKSMDDFPDELLDLTNISN